jgi:hypothetical protein
MANQKDMESKDIYKKVLNGVDYLNDLLTEYEDALMESVAQYAKNKDLSSIPQQISKAEKLKSYIVKVNELKREFNNLHFGDQTETAAQNDTDKEIAAYERTEWWIVDEAIKVETRRPDGTPYSNIIPISIFSHIVKVTSDFIYNKGSVKTSDVLKILQNEIVSQSDYKKTPRIPVYATFKVLVKEKLLKIDSANSRKYIKCVPIDQFNQWLNNFNFKD